jgi:hypothetical protein
LTFLLALYCSFEYYRGRIAPPSGAALFSFLGQEARCPIPVLQIKGKTAVESYHWSIPHHVREFDKKLSVLDKGQEPSLDGNLIIEGDNLLAFKALLPTHAGRIKCIYIDPPYNTGNEGWVYNDNLTQSQFKEWIGQVVGKEAESATGFRPSRNWPSTSSTPRPARSSTPRRRTRRQVGSARFTTRSITYSTRPTRSAIAPWTCNGSGGLLRKGRAQGALAETRSGV